MHPKKNSNDRSRPSIGADQAERFNNSMVESKCGHCSLEKTEGRKLMPPAFGAAGRITAPPLVAGTYRPRFVLRPDGAQKKSGFGNTMFYRLQNPNDPLFDPEFPVSFAILGGRARGYFEDEIDAWLERQAAKDPRRQRLTSKAHDTGAHASGKPKKFKTGDEK